MKNVFIIFLILWAFINISNAQNNLCLTSDPFCTGTTYDFPAGVDAGSGESGPNYGCLYSTPNPAWYYMQIDQSGDIDIYMQSNPNVDIDFACWGPFTDQDTPCTAQLTAACTSCPNNTSNPTFYPSGNLVDCSYSTSWNETVHINNGVTGQWYILLITNYSNSPTNIIFSQTGGNGTTNCGIMPTPASNNGPLCVGETLILHANPVANATYNWTGPNGFSLSTTVDSVIIPNVTLAVAGTYTLTNTVGSQTSNPTTTVVVINANPIVTANNSAVCAGATATVTATGAATYAWATGQTTAVINVVPTTTTTYYVLGTDANGCMDTAIATVIVNPNPTSTFTSPPVCGSIPPTQLNYATITWTGTAAPGASFFWTFGPGSGNPQTYQTSSAQGPHNLYWADVVTVTVYNITLTVTNPVTGCVSTTNGQIQVLPSNSQPNCCVIPVPVAGNDTSVCGLVDQLNALLGPGNTGVWSQISGPGTSVFADSTLTNTFVTVSTPGQYQFQWHENSGATCFANDAVTINFIQIPNANAGPDQIVCGNTTNMQAVVSVGTGQWYGPNTLFSPSNSAGANAQTSVYDTLTYIWVETNSMCIDTDYVDVLFHEVPNPDAGPNQTVCGNNVDLIGTPNGYTFLGYWTGPNGTLFSESDTANAVTAMILPYTSQQNVTFWWHQSNEMCVDSDQVVITFQPYAGPSQVSAGFDNSTCDSLFQLHGIIQGVTGTGQWSSTNNQVIIGNSLDANTFIYIDPATTNYSTDSSKYQVTMTWTVSNGAGCTAMDNVVITFYETPQADAGEDLSICGLKVKMGASFSISASDGQWTLFDSPGPGCSNPSYDDDNNPGTHIQVSCYGLYSFVWREKNHYNNTCSTTDTVVVEFVEYPTISGGTDQWICGDTVYLQAIPSANTAGQTWMTAPVTWYDLTTHLADTLAQKDPATIALHLHTVNDSVIFQWQEYNQATINNLQCPSVDTVIVYFYVYYPAVEFIDSQWDTVQCGYIYDGLNAQTPPEGYGYWLDTLGTTTFTPLPTSLNATATTESYGMHHLYWVVENGEKPNGDPVCIDSSEVIPIRFIEIPVANSGGNLWAANPDSVSEIKWDTACGNKYALHPVLSGIGTVQWQILSTTYPRFIYTSSSTSPMPNDTVISGSLYNSDQTAPPYYYEVFLQLDNSVLSSAPWSHGCIDRDTLRITFARIPTGEIEFRKPYCYGQTALIYPEFDPQGKPNQFSWSFGNGTIDSTRNNPATPTIQNDSLNYVSWDTTGGNMYHIVSLFTSNAWGCVSSSTTDTIWEPTPVYPLDSVYATTCMQPNGRIIVFPDDSLSTTYYWLDLEFAGDPYASEQNNLISDKPYHVRFRYESWEPNIFCYDTITYIIPDTGKVTAQFIIPGDTTHLIPLQSIVFFTNGSTGGKNWEWHFGDGTTSSTESPDHIYATGGVFYVYLIAKSKEGCESMSDSIAVEIEKSSELIVPNIFTPNGDNKNDYFQVTAKTIKSFKGIITNRWGKTLFEWTEWNKKLVPTSGWDGKINGNDAAPGVYYYMITAEGWDNVKYDLKAAFHLERDK